MIDPVLWLGVWEELDAPGRHQKRFPAPDAFGYKFCPTYYGSKVPWDAGPRYTMWDRVNRAIPVEGTMERISWAQSPQARMWLDEPPKTIRQLLKEWWNR